MKQLRLTLFGNVQGVGLRNWLQTNAQALKLTGFARNEADGTVIVVAQGHQEVLEKFLKMCYDGPIFAQITHATPEWEDIHERFTSFEIL